jgi:hypothetical protein
MRNQLAIVGTAVLFITVVGLSGCNGPTCHILVNKSDTEVFNYVNMTEQQMEKFPHLNEAINASRLENLTSAEIPLEEFYELKGILKFKGTDFIKYKNEYYEIRLILGDHKIDPED